MNARYNGKTLEYDPDVISFVGVYDYVNQLTELWFGMGMAYQVNDKLGLGATFFGCYRGQSYQLTNYVKEIEKSDTSQVFRTQTNDESLEYNVFRLLTKFGLSYLNGRWKAGLTLTTPSIPQYGKGDAQRENSVIAASDNPLDSEDNFLIMDSKTGEKANYRHPLSIGLGVEYKTGKTRIALSAEYFFRLAPYHLIEPDAAALVYPPSYLDSANYRTLIDNYLHVEIATRPVLNVGLGFSQAVYRNITLLLGAYTDFSSYENSAQSNELLSGYGDYNIYHLAAGLSYFRKKQSISLGFTYAFAPSKQVPPYAIINQTADFTENARLSAYSYTFVLGYTYYFSKFSE
jgi:long-subunit fatty acid transport protein